MTRFSLATASLAVSVSLGPAWAGQPLFGKTFSAVWHDGNAELASYDLTYPRYGAERSGTAVAITVTEPFSWEPRVKADGDDTFGVVKLNLVEDFATGIYDYNLMTSAFMTTEPVEGLPAGAPVKLTFTAQEWCGHAFQQAVFFPGKVEHRGFSYFEGEAEEKKTFRVKGAVLAEDALFLWARGLAAPAVGPGEEVEVPLYRSAAVVRLSHVPQAIDEAELERGEQTEELETAIGTITVREASVEVDREDAPDLGYTFYVEEAAPHRIVKWTPQRRLRGGAGRRRPDAVLADERAGHGGRLVGDRARAARAADALIPKPGWMPTRISRGAGAGLRLEPGCHATRLSGASALQRSTRAPPPATSFSTSFSRAIEVSPGVVIASAPWAAPYSTAFAASPKVSIP